MTLRDVTDADNMVITQLVDGAQRKQKETDEASEAKSNGNNVTSAQEALLEEEHVKLVEDFEFVSAHAIAEEFIQAGTMRRRMSRISMVM